MLVVADDLSALCLGRALQEVPPSARILPCRPFSFLIGREFYGPSYPKC